jgi:hypothetical protein
MRVLRNLAASTTLVVAGAVALSPAASAATPLEIGSAVLTNAALATGGGQLNGPASRVSSFVATEPLAGFPRHGGSFAILSSGNAADAYGAQSVQRSTPFNLSGRAGGSDFDATVMRVDFTVPASANCLMGFDFKFLSEEYPEYVGDVYNDAFIAELDRTTWTSVGTTITAPDNFAFDPNGQVVSINAAGEAVLNATNAAGTSYDGATDILTAATPLTPGPHSLYFTIFDQADGGLDSTVLIDNLRIGHVNDVGAECKAGAQAAKTLVTPAATTFADPYGSQDDEYTVPSTLGVEYRVGGVVTGAGTFPGTGTVTVTAVAEEGYEISGTSSWSHTFTDVQPATAVAPTQHDTYGTADDTFTVPAVTGVEYQVDGVPVVHGTHPGVGTVVVTASAATGYVLTDGPTSWELAFTDITLVSAQAPTQVDGYGTDGDTFTVPTTTGVTYQVDGADVAAGPHPGTGTVVVTAVAQPGYELTGPTSFSLPFTDIREASAVEPTKVDGYGTDGDTFTVPTTMGVTYQVDGADVAAGTHPGTGTVVVTAVAQPGYELTGPDSFTLEFTDIRLATPVAPTQVDGYGTDGDTYAVASTTGVRYQVDGTDVAAGTHAGTGTVVVTAVAEDGYVLSGPTSFSLVFTDIHQVAAAAPTQVDDFGTASDTFTVPSVVGVRYLVGGTVVAAGTHPGTGTVVVTAEAEDGYELTGPATFSLVFTDLQAVSPVAPGHQDKGGTTHDTYTLPVVPGITYLVDGQPVAPGTYPATRTVVVTVVAAPGYAVDGPGTFTLVFDPAVEAVAVAVPDLEVVPSRGTTAGTYTIPAIEGVRFLVDGEEVPPGTYTGSGRVVVTVVADEGYELAGADELSFDLGRVLSVVAAPPVRPGTPSGGAGGAGGTGGTGGTGGVGGGEPAGFVRDEERVTTVAAPVRADALARTGAAAGAGPLLAASALLTAAGAVLVAGSRRRGERA